MKILLFTLEYPPFFGGVANYYGNLVKYWPKPLEIFVLDNNKGGLINKKAPVLKWLPALLRLWRVVKKEKINYVLVGQILPLGIVAYLISKIIKIKYTMFLHGMDFTFAIHGSRKSWITRKILKNSDKIICGNSYVAGLAQKFCQEVKNKISIVNPGVEPKSKIQNTNYKLQITKYNLENKIVLLSVGRLVKRKGFNMVIEAMPKVLEKIPNLVYIMLGNGEEITNYKLQITNYKLENNVFLLGDVPDEARNMWLNLCDIFIMPSKNIKNDFEGFGIVYLEANMAGKPVIAGNSGGVGDAVIDGLNGLLVDPENLDQITNAIIELAENPFLRQKLGEQGRQRAIDKFDWKKQVLQIYRLINKYENVKIKNQNAK